MKKWLVVIILFSGVIAVSISQYRSILTAYAKFFTVNNATPGADVIVVLSGGKDTRIPHALKLFEEGYAPEILLTDEKKRNIRFSHLFPTNEMIAQAMQMLNHQTQVVQQNQQQLASVAHAREQSQQPCWWMWRNDGKMPAEVSEARRRSEKRSADCGGATCAKKNIGGCSMPCE